MIIDRLWKMQPGKYFCISTKSSTKKWTDTFFARDEIHKINKFFIEHSDKDIYFCPHGFSKPHRQKENAVLPKLLWSDLDEADPRTLKYKPTVAFESSPGRFVGLWFIDQTMTESLNRRMSYGVGADKSGWDLTQVLRVPGTRNYKYTHAPRVKILWDDGPSYEVDSLERRLPKPDKERSDNGSTETDAAEIYKKHQKIMPPWLRRELLNGKPREGKRSEMVWKIGQTLIECGIDTEDAFILLKASPWNKFAGRHNEDEQLQRELDKAINHHIVGSRTRDPEEDEGVTEKSMFLPMSEVEEENIDWILYPYLARGEVSIVEGDPGLGKSYMVQILSIYLCDGFLPPHWEDIHRPVKGPVVYFDIENSAGTVTKKRLSVNGLKNMQNFIQCSIAFSIGDENYWDRITEFFEKTRPVMAVFDTVNTYLGGTDAFKAHEVAQIFGRFKELAQRFNCSVVVLRHLTKSGKERAIYRGQGSIAFTGSARVVMTVGCLPDDPSTRVMTMSKNNLAPFPRGISFTIVALPDKLDSKNRSKFEWGDFVDLSSDDIIAPPKSVEKNNDLEVAKKFIEEALTEAPSIEVEKLVRMAEARTISRRTLYRAAESLGVQKSAKGFGKLRRSYWSKA